MSRPNLVSNHRLLPLLLGVCGVVALGIFWLSGRSDGALKLRVPGTDQAPGSELGTNGNAVVAGRLQRKEGQSANLPGTWPQFRGPERNGISPETVPLGRSWPSAAPKELWGVDLGEGYAGAAVQGGRVYVMDYDQTNRQDALRCFSLEDGREIWRFAYANPVKRNHGMSRTTPAVTEKIAVAIGPKCHVVCLDSVTGDLRWGLDLVRQYGATVPPWYAGQCPLLDRGNLILAPGGKAALLLAVEAESGKPVWTTPNPRGWKMTHSSIMPMEIGGERMYVYCANNGVVGVSAENGALLWETTDWKISIATVPSPLVLDGGRIFFSGGYNAGSLMLQVSKAGDRYTTRTLFKLEPEVFGATQHTPILYDNHIYGVRPDGKFVCLTTDGRTVWSGDAAGQLGLGPFLLADGVIFAMNDSGMLCLLEATADKCNLLGKAQVLHGRESWAPLALAGGRLLARDLTRMVCLDVGKK